LLKLTKRKQEVTARVKEFLICCEKGEADKVNAMLTGELNGKPIARVSVQCADDKGNTGLHKAAATNQLEILKLLLKKGAILTRNSEIDSNTELGKKFLGKNPLDVAQEKNHVAIIGELKNRPNAIISIAKQMRRYQAAHQHKHGHRNELNEAIVQDMERLHQAQVNMISYLDQRLTTELDDTAENVSELKKKQAQMEQQMALMFKMMQHKDTVELIIQRFKQNNNLITFYRTVQIKLSEIFCAIRSISSGMVPHAQEGDGKVVMIASGIELLGQVVSLLPLGGQFASTIAGFISGQVRNIDYQQQLALIRSMSLMLTNKEQEEVCESVARLLCQRFEKQIMLLASLQQAKEILKAHCQQQGLFKRIMGVVGDAKSSSDELIYKATPKAFTQMVAEFAVLCVLEALQAQKIITPGHENYSDSTLSLEEQLFREVIIPVTNQSCGYNPLKYVSKVAQNVSESISDLMGTNKIVTNDKRIWTLKEFYKKPGIFTPEGNYFASDNTQPELYDYREGTQEEVTTLNFKLVKSDSRVGAKKETKIALPSANQSLSELRLAVASLNTLNITNVPVATPAAAPVAKNPPEAIPAAVHNPFSINEGMVAINIRISSKEFTLDKRLGHGAFGEVFSGTYNGAPAAIKKLKGLESKPALLKEFESEASINVRLLHPSIVKLFGICLEEQNHAMVMEYMPNGNLYNFLRDPAKSDQWAIRYRIATEITSGLVFMHSRNVIHGDLKSLNILLDETHHAKICDFGIAKIKKSSEKDAANSTEIGASSGGSVAWMAPELFSENNQNTYKSDVYSYGVILWEIATGKQPFEKLNVYRITYLQGGKDYNRETDNPIPKEPPSMAKLIKWCWNKDPKDRPDMSQAVPVLQEEYEKNYKSSPKP
jgi:hypothetical protein